MTSYKHVVSINNKKKTNELLTNKKKSSAKRLTNSSSFNVARGIADVNPAFLFVAAIVFKI